MTDKQSDTEKTEKAPEKTDREAKPRRARPGSKATEAAVAAKKAAGPEIVKVQKQRKLVAAGLAEEVEIQAELENPEDSAAESAE